jgi:hypothetical protein
MPETISKTHPIFAEQILTNIPVLYDKSLGALLSSVVMASMFIMSIAI